MPSAVVENQRGRNVLLRDVVQIIVLLALDYNGLDINYFEIRN